jgi:hypothetical protein
MCAARQGVVSDFAGIVFHRTWMDARFRFRTNLNVDTMRRAARHTRRVPSPVFPVGSRVTIGVGVATSIGLAAAAVPRTMRVIAHIGVVLPVSTSVIVGVAFGVQFVLPPILIGAFAVVRTVRTRTSVCIIEALLLILFASSVALAVGAMMLVVESFRSS